MAAGDTGAANLEVLGGIAIPISADYSSMAAAFAASQALAQAAGTEIADALAAGGAAGADLGDEIAQGLEPITPAADDATASITALGGSLSDAIDPATNLGAATDAAAGSVSGAGDAADEATGYISAFGDSSSSAATTVGDLGDESSDAAGSVGELGDQASEAADSAGELNDELPDAAGSAGELGDSAHEAGSALEQMAEQMAAVGEALVITEGLKEFGSEALAAADAIKTANIALTNITGSASAAAEQIEGLEQLGMADGLAMPSLLTAAQRMTEMLPPGTDVTTLLGQIADGAAVMGTSIDQASNRFDQLVNSGSASARTLGSLGLSLPTLSAALNQVAGASVSTEDDVAAMFKGLDDQGRIAVLQSALSNLGGTAQQVANQTFGGQWQQLANAWESIMAQVGTAILPVITDLIDFTKTDIIPFVQSAVSAFTSLPGPVKDVAVAGGLLLASIIPLSGAISAASLAVSGLGGLIPAVSGVMSTLGLTSTSVAAAQTAQAATTAEVGNAAAAATPEITAEAAAIEAVGSAATESAIQYDLFATSVIGTNWGAEAEQLNLFADAERNVGAGAAASGEAMSLTATGGVLVLAGGIGSLIGAYEAWRANAALQQESNDQLMATVTSLNAALQKHGVAFQGLNDAYNNGEITLVQLVSSLQGLVSQYDASVAGLQSNTNNTLLLSGALKDLTTSTQKQALAFDNAASVYTAVNQALATGIPLYAQTKANLNDQMNAMEGVVSAASKTVEGIGNATVAIIADQLAAEKASLSYQAVGGAFHQLLDAFNSGNATQAQVTTAFNKMEAAENAAAAAGVPIPGSLQAINQAAAGVVNTMTNLASSQQLASDQTIAQNDNITSLSAAALVADQKLDLLRQEQDTLSASVSKGTAQQSQLNAVMGQVEAAATAAQAATFKLQTAQLNQGNAAAAASGQIGLVNQSLAEAQLAMDQATAKFDAGTISVSQYTSAQKALLSAQIAAAQAQAEQNSGMQGSLSPLGLATEAYVAAAAKLQILTQAYKDNKASASDVAGAITAALNAQIAQAQEQAVVQSGLQGTTTQYGLLETAVVEAQAKVDVLTQAQQSGQDVAAQLVSANQALTTAQDTLNKSVGASSPLLVAANTNTIALAYTNGQLVPTVGSATNAINSQTAALQQDATALQSVAAAVAQVEADMSSAIGAANGSKGISGGGAGTVVRSTGLGYFGQEEYSVTQVPNLTQAQFDGLVDKYGLAFAKGVEANYNAIGYSDNYSPTTVTAATSGATGAASSTTSGLTTDQSPIIVSSLPGGSTTTGTTSTTAASASPVTTTTSAGTSAVDGGSYPAVTAHQAAGEIWAVSASGAGATGGAVGTGSTADLTTAISAAVGSTAQTSANAISTAAGSIGGAADQIATFSGGLLPISSALTATAAATAQVASDIGGILLHLTTTSGGGLNPIATSGTSPTAGTISTVASGTVNVYYGSGNPQGPTVPLPPTQNPTTGPGANAVTVQASFDLRGANLGGTPSAQVQQKLTQAVTNGMVQALFTSGARLTRYAP